MKKLPPDLNEYLVIEICIWNIYKDFG